MNPETNGTKIGVEAPEINITFIDSVRDLIHQAYQSLKLHSASDYPIEAVGIICDGGITYPLINQARSPHRYEVSKQLVTEALDVLNARGLLPLGFYHTHPTSNPEPSKRDVLLMSENPNSLFIIVGQYAIAAWITQMDGHSPFAIKHIVEVTDVEHSRSLRT